MMPVNIATQELDRLQESVDLLSSYVDPAGAYMGDDGERWIAIGGAVSNVYSDCMYSTEQELAEIRKFCRMLAATSEFAICGHENRINYIVGTGHVYQAVAKKGETPGDDLIESVQGVIDDFIRENRWHQRQQEIVRRNDRDGETFLRFFPPVNNGVLRVRFVEPGQVSTPANRAADKNCTYGIRREPDDVEMVLGYFVDGEEVPAEEIQHRKCNVDCNSKRGMPLFNPCKKNLLRADKILRNMSATMEIQTAIAMVRKHLNATKASVQSFAAGSRDAYRQNAVTGKTENAKQYPPGSILDVSGNTDLQFPAQGLDPSRAVACLAAILRAIASRLVMPEFMLTSDASNANYSSTLVAEGPAVKQFERQQASQIEFDKEVIDRAIKAAIALNREGLPANVMELVEIQVTAPRLTVRDAVGETSRHSVMHAAGVLSKKTWAAKEGLDFEQEQENIDAELEAAVGTAQPGMNLPGVGGDDTVDGDGKDDTNNLDDKGKPKPKDDGKKKDGDK